MIRTEALATLAAFCAIGIACAQPGAPRRTSPGDLPVEIRLELEQQRFIAKESMVLHIHIRNTGQAPIEVPNPENNRNTQPVYTVTGPSYPEGHKFHFRGVVLGNPNPPTEPELGGTVRLARGQTHDAALPLEQLVRFPKPGAHTISASVEIEGRSTTSAPVPFEIEAAVIRSMEILADDGMQTSNPIRILCLVGAPPHQRLYQAVFREERPDLGEVYLAKLVYVAPAPAEATEVFGPWTNHDRLDSLLNRFGWQGGARVGVEGLGGAPGLAFRFSEKPLLVRPALMPESGDLDVMALVGGGRSLQMLRFPASPQARAARVVWTRQLDVASVGSRAALGTRTAGERRAAVLVAPEQNDDSRMILVESGAEGEPSLRIVHLPGAAPLPDCEPGISFLPDGTILTSALFSEKGQAREAFVVDVHWPAGSGEGTVAREKFKRLSAMPRSAAVTYSVAGGQPRRDWIVLLVNGTIVFSGTPTRPRGLSETPSLPLKLLGMSRMTYLLTLDQEGLPRLELVH
jgi:hypothetical protein